MRKPDELALYAALRHAEPRTFRSIGREGVETIMDRLEIPHKRGYALMEKWIGRGWMECGVSVPYGWFTDKAPETLQR